MPKKKQGNSTTFVPRNDKVGIIGISLCFFKIKLYNSEKPYFFENLLNKFLGITLNNITK